MDGSPGNSKPAGPARRLRPGTGRATLAEVARAAGVSTATVSRVFNDPDKVSDEMRERVHGAARAINWIPNAAGRALASSRTHIAGVIIPTFDNEIFARQVGGMQQIFAEHGLTLLVGCSNYDPAEGLRQAEVMLARGVEALAVVGESHPPALFAALAAHRVPYVTTYGYDRASPHPKVGFDNRAAFAQIVTYLLELGHRRFAAVFQPERDNDRVRARLQGIDETLAKAGLAIAPDHRLIGPSTMEFGAQSLHRLRQSPARSRATAIVCGNDSIALGALLEAREIGVEVPREMSITGFDDLSLSSRITPRLTTMWVDNHEIGRLAALHLVETLRSGTAPRSTECEAVLRVRGSASAPSANEDG